MSIVKINGKEVKHKGEKNLLELIRSVGIELPTFCYQPELSVFGSCRMCIVELEDGWVVPACSTSVKDGMVVQTNTKRIRDARKMIVELMLASHDQDCKTCVKSGGCKLQSVAKDLGVTEVRFKQGERADTVDNSADIVRDTGKCILCGNCVRMCSEKQAVGVLDFAYRGSNAKVLTEFNRGMAKTQCVSCGQCVQVCPVGALVAKSHIDGVWDAIADKSKTVIVQIAPAVRVSVGEYFGLKAGTMAIGKIITALRRIGFDKVYDTSFAADLTVIEEGREFIERLNKGGLFPHFTSCCPAWVKWVEQFHPELLPNLSTACSPQQMFGALAKDKFGRDVVVVSVMPCVAKKAESRRPEFGGSVDFVITTAELAQMIKQSGMDFAKLEDGTFDAHFGMSSGAAVRFGATGGVANAVIRYLEKEIGREKVEGVKSAVVSGLDNAKKLVLDIKEGKKQYDIVEVMACSGGCVGGGGQPSVCSKTVKSRKKGLLRADKLNPIKVSCSNPEIQELYKSGLDIKKAHDILHTSYTDKKRY